MDRHSVFRGLLLPAVAAIVLPLLAAIALPMVLSSHHAGDTVIRAGEPPVSPGSAMTTMAVWGWRPMSEPRAANVTELAFGLAPTAGLAGSPAEDTRVGAPLRPPGPQAGGGEAVSAPE